MEFNIEITIKNLIDKEIFIEYSKLNNIEQINLDPTAETKIDTNLNKFELVNYFNNTTLVNDECIVSSLINEKLNIKYSITRKNNKENNDYSFLKFEKQQLVSKFKNSIFKNPLEFNNNIILEVNSEESIKWILYSLVFSVTNTLNSFENLNDYYFTIELFNKKLRVLNGQKKWKLEVIQI